MKSITTYLISILHQTLYAFKPFNPIIGETFQCKIVHEGTDFSPLDVYLEQTSHHPPIFNFYAVHELFTIYGHRNSKAVSSGNSLDATISGTYNIKFKDGTHYTLEYGRYVLHGILLGARTTNFEGNFIITDHTNNLKSIFTVNPQPKTGFFSKIFGGKEKKNFPDYLKGFIANSSDITYDKKNDVYSAKEEHILSRYEGEFTNSISFDGNLKWSLDDDQKLGKLHRMPFTLTSDSRLRTDLLIYKKGKTEIAQFAKMSLEDLQRHDVKLRKQYHNKENK